MGPLLEPPCYYDFVINKSLIQGKNILLRADLDVPIESGRVTNDFRLQAMLPTLRLCQENAKSTLIIGHLGRPEGIDPRFELKPIQEWLEKAIGQSISFFPSGFSPGEWVRGANSTIALYENLRFSPGELSLDREFAKLLSAGSDLYVYDAFASYNDGASLQLIPELLPTYTGIQFDREVEELMNILKTPARPSILLLSGAKEDKGRYVDNFVKTFDKIIIGGKLASLIVNNQHPNVMTAKLTMDGFDIVDDSVEKIIQFINSAKTIVMNGPLGKFEDGIHATATKKIFEAIVHSPARSVLGGGDTLAAIPALGFSYSDFDFVSTGGGAMLEFIASGTHPLLEVLKNLPQKSLSS